MDDVKSLSMMDLRAFLSKVEDGAGRDAALREAFLEVGQAMAEIVELLTKQGPATAKEIAEALRGVKVAAELKTPELHIDVKPTPVEVKVAGPTVNVPPPVVHVMPGKRGGWRFVATPLANGGFEIDATPVP